MSQFDEIWERKNTNSLKYDFAEAFGMPEDVLPLWVADMDFKAPKEVLEALQERVAHGIFGYSETKEAYCEKVITWFRKMHGWEPKAEWLVKSPGVVFAINCAIRAYTKKGEAILIQEPVYYPFRQSIENNNRICINNELKYNNGRYEMDLEDFEKKIVDNGVTMFILCSPHNPVGRVWTEAELKAVGGICKKHGVFVISDEIHCDFTYPGHVHRVFSQVCKDMETMCMICTAPSKTFNLAGLQVSNIFIPEKEKRDRFKRAMKVTGYEEITAMGITACEAAYMYGEGWLLELREYLRCSLDFVRDFLYKNLPQIRLVEPEGTYLIWLDFSAYGLTQEEVNRRIIEEAGLWFDKGSMFGKESGQFQRINMACPRSVIEETMKRLQQAFGGK